jgi:hypothetical protein
VSRHEAPAIAALLSACGMNPTVLPGSLDLPVVAGSEIVECPPELQEAQTSCVIIPNGERTEGIVETYQRSLQELGFRFERYVSSPNVVLLSKISGTTCEALLVGSTSGQESLTLTFHLVRRPATECHAG